MSTLIKGSIPAMLNFHISSKGDDDAGRGVFVCDSTNAGTNKTAANWANHYLKQWDHKTQTYIDNEPRLPLTNIPNAPFTGVKLVNFERRDQGGRAYKVTFPHDGETLLFDMRDDMLLEIIEHAGIEKGGHLKGEYVFGMVGSEMKIVLNDGPTYKALLAKDKVKKSPVISKFEVGTVYANTQDNVLYLGQHLINSELCHVFFRVSLTDDKLSDSNLTHPRMYSIKTYTSTPTSFRKVVGSFENFDLLKFLTDLRTRMYDELTEQIQYLCNEQARWATNTYGSVYGRRDYTADIIRREWDDFNAHWVHAAICSVQISQVGV